MEYMHMKDPIIDLPFFCRQFSSLELFNRIDYLSDVNDLFCNFYIPKNITDDFKKAFNIMRGQAVLHAIDIQHNTKVGIIDPSKEISIGEHFRNHFTKYYKHVYKHIEFGDEKINIVNAPEELLHDSTATLEYSFNVNFFKYEIALFLSQLINFLYNVPSKKAIIFSRDIIDTKMSSILNDLKDEYLKNMSAIAIISENPKLMSTLKNIYVNTMFITGKEPGIQMNYAKFLYYKQPALTYVKHREDLYEEIKKHV